MENQCPGPGAGRCHGHARPEAKQKVGVKVCASAAGRPSASAPGARGWRRGGTGPGAPGPSRSRGRDRSAERGFGLPPAPEARGVLAGRGRPSLPTAEAGSSRQPVRRRERDPEPPPPSPRSPYSAPGPGWRLEDTAGPEVPARNTHTGRTQLGQLFWSWGKFLQWCFVALRHVFNALAEKEAQPS